MSNPSRLPRRSPASVSVLRLAAFEGLRSLRPSWRVVSGAAVAAMFTGVLSVGVFSIAEPARATGTNPAIVQLNEELTSDGSGSFPADRNSNGVEEAGDDFAATPPNNRVRTGDTVVYHVGWSVNLPNPVDDPATSHPVVKFTLPARLAVSGLPTGATCPGGTSTVPNNPDLERVFTCDQGIFYNAADNPTTPGTGTASVTRVADITFTVPLDYQTTTQFSLKTRIETEHGNFVELGDEPPLKVIATGAPGADLFKGSCFTNPCLPSDTAPSNLVDPSDNVTKPGFYFDYIVGLRAPFANGDYKGISKLAEPVEFGDDVRIPAGLGTDGTQHYGVGAGLPGLTLVTCDNSNAHPGAWPGGIAANANIGNANTQFHRPTIACAQPGGKGTPVKISMGSFDYDRVQFPQNVANTGVAAFLNSIIGYGHIRYFLSYDDWKTILSDRNGGVDLTRPCVDDDPLIAGDQSITTACTDTLPDNSTRVVGTVELGDRLQGLDAGGNPVVAANSGTCNNDLAPNNLGKTLGGQAQSSWVGPTNGSPTPAKVTDINTLDPSTFHPLDASGNPNLQGANEPAEDNGACTSQTIRRHTPSSFGSAALQKFPIGVDTNYGLVVTPDTLIDTGLQIAVGSATMTSTTDVLNQNRWYKAGTATCDKWDNRTFSPRSSLGADWISPIAIPAAAATETRAAGPNDYNAEYGSDAYTTLYAKGNWGSHNPSSANGFYLQGSTACADDADTATGVAASALLPIDGTGAGLTKFWATPAEVDFTNAASLPSGKRIAIKDVNAVRISLNHPLPHVLPSEVTSFNIANDPASVTDDNPIVRSPQAQWKLSWQNNPGVPLPAQMRNYAIFNRNSPNGTDNPVVWESNIDASGANDTTHTAKVNPPCGRACAQNSLVGTGDRSLWWQILGPNANVNKVRVSPAGAVAVAGDPATFRIRAWGTPPGGFAADATGNSLNVEIRDVLEPGLSYVPGSVTVAGGSISLGEPSSILQNTNRITTSTGYTTLVWTVPSLPWATGVATAPLDFSYQVKTPPFVGPGQYDNTAFIKAPESADFTHGEAGTENEVDVDNFKFTTASVNTPSLGNGAYLNKFVTPSTLDINTPFSYLLQYGNGGNTAIEDMDAIDILPWPGDPAHGRTSVFSAGDIKLLDVVPSAKNEAVWVSAIDPAVLDAQDAADPNGGADDDGYLNPHQNIAPFAVYAGAVGGSDWPCTFTQAKNGTGGASCPDVEDITALRFIGSGTPAARFLGAGAGPYNIELKYTTTATAHAGQVYDNGWLANFDGAGGLDFPIFRPISIKPTFPAPATPPKVSVGNYVWIDVNQDGKQDSTDVPLEGIVLSIKGPNNANVTDINGNPVTTTTTDSTGHYLFPNLPPLPAGQHYTVFIDNNQSGITTRQLVPTKLTVGTDNSIDSSTNSAESKDLPNDGDEDLTLDFGFLGSVSVGDYVWIDVNNDGLQDGTDVPIAGAVLRLTGPDGNPVTNVLGNVVGTTTTDSNGKYLFDKLPILPAGQHYTVHLDSQPYGDQITPTTPGAGTDRAKDSSTLTAESGDLTVNLAHDPTLDFGFVYAPPLPPVIPPPAPSPSLSPSPSPSGSPSASPTPSPSCTEPPGGGPSSGPSSSPGTGPSTGPSSGPSNGPSSGPSTGPSNGPGTGPSPSPSCVEVSPNPSGSPSGSPSPSPSGNGSASPSASASVKPPTASPTSTIKPTTKPSPAKSTPGGLGGIGNNGETDTTGGKGGVNGAGGSQIDPATGLPYTGSSNLGGIGVIAFYLIAFGAGFVALARKRRSYTPKHSLS